MNKKYILLKNDSVIRNNKVLYRIKASRNFNDVNTGDLGGYIEKEENLSHGGGCWVYDNVQVSSNAEVSDNARVSGNAKVSDNACVSGNAEVYGNACVSDN